MPATFLHLGADCTCGIARQVLDTALSGKEFLVGNKFSIADIASYCWVVSAPCAAAVLMLWFHSLSNVPVAKSCPTSASPLHRSWAHATDRILVQVGDRGL